MNTVDILLTIGWFAMIGVCLYYDYLMKITRDYLFTYAKIVERNTERACKKRYLNEGRRSYYEINPTFDELVKESNLTKKQIIKVTKALDLYQALTPSYQDF